MSEIIKISNLYTRFNNTVIHKDLNLNITQGEVIALIGGSGTGKTTLMREIIMLEKPTMGSIQVFSQEICDLAEKQALQLRRRWGVMFQHGALFSSLTVSENVAVPLREHSRLSDRSVQEIVALKIALTGLTSDVGIKYPDQLSGGMIKRVALARALALDPDILFLDEPTAGLDPIGADALDKLILQLKKLLGLTIVMVTHDLDSLWKITDRVAVLADKQVFAVAPVQELSQLDHPWIHSYFQGARGRAASHYSKRVGAGLTQGTFAR